MRPAGRRELVFVYDADSGTWSKLFDAAHKVISPATYSCSLCALTYGMVSMRREWAQFVRSLPHAVRFAYRDEIRREHAVAPPLPALLERRDGAWITLLDKPQIAACKNVDELIARVREALT
ncbi:MAG: hypothetical protein H0V17_30820 [Deltaproteobacteria bacterium]|nr:hypothetical protein [Deltaproteobacteria bacterium]